MWIVSESGWIDVAERNEGIGIEFIAEIIIVDAIFCRDCRDGANILASAGVKSLYFRES